MKRLSFVLVLCLVLVSIVIGTTFCIDKTYRALVPTKLYSSMDFETAIADIPQNQAFSDVEQIDDSWYKVTVFGKTGYVDKRAIYSTTTDLDFSYTTMRVDAGGFDTEVSLYYYPTQDSEIYTTLKDNVQLEVAEGGIDYGDFSAVKYDGGIYYIMDQDITTGLTYSQIVAIILGVIGGILVVTLVFLLIYGFRLKLR